MLQIHDVLCKTKNNSADIWSTFLYFRTSNNRSTETARVLLSVGKKTNCYGVKGDADPPTVVHENICLKKSVCVCVCLLVGVSYRILFFLLSLPLCLSSQFFLNLLSDLIILALTEFTVGVPRVPRGSVHGGEDQGYVMKICYTPYYQESCFFFLNVNYHWFVFSNDWKTFRSFLVHSSWLDRVKKLRFTPAVQFKISNSLQVKVFRVWNKCYWRRRVTSTSHSCCHHTLSFSTSLLQH